MKLSVIIIGIQYCGVLKFTIQFKLQEKLNKYDIYWMHHSKYDKRHISKKIMDDNTIINGISCILQHQFKKERSTDWYTLFISYIKHLDILCYYIFS